MSVGRVVAACVASLAVVGCVAVAVGMGHAASKPTTGSSSISADAARSSRPAFLPMSRAAGDAATSSRLATTAASHLRTTAAHPSASLTSSAHSAAPLSSPSARVATSTTAQRTSATPSPARTSSTTAVGQALPLRYRTGTATRVITVTARSTGSTTATLQAWTKVAGGGWRKSGTAVTAHVGSDGLSSQPSEYRSATPMGSFTLTQAFGRYSDPGTALSYFQTRPSDWWISQAGALYNTHQRCSSGCSFTLGSPNEHLYYETPYYNYAVVIDYNTRNAPGGVVQGAGSAFFLHVTDGSATAGCVAISQAKLVSLMRWLTPSTHPRILIGVS
jgi:L,D-peptidoglycan transpeptidase YkuD (ErfK/YbiS/YcfS/YnhG family)